MYCSKGLRPHFKTTCCLGSTKGVAGLYGERRQRAPETRGRPTTLPGVQGECKEAASKARGGKEVTAVLQER